MSRIGKQKIIIPAGTEVKKETGKEFGSLLITVKGPLGEVVREFKKGININIENNEINLTPEKEEVKLIALWGTYASHLKNMIKGVNSVFQKKLIVEGVGFKSEVSGKNLVLALGFSHQVIVPIPNDLKVTAEKNVITIEGVNKENVGQFTASVRSFKKPEPYKGKGIHYEGEVIRRKQGKKAS